MQVGHDEETLGRGGTFDKVVRSEPLSSAAGVAAMGIQCHFGTFVPFWAECSDA